MLRSVSRVSPTSRISHRPAKSSTFNIPKRRYATREILYTEDHDWVKFDGDLATVGITDYAQQQLGDVVFVDAPKTGQVLSKGDTMAVVESVKAASDIYSPVSGEVVEGNANLSDNPAIVNSDPTNEGWIAKIRVKDVASQQAELLNQEAYDKIVEEAE